MLKCYTRCHTIITMDQRSYAIHACSVISAGTCNWKQILIVKVACVSFHIIKMSDYVKMPENIHILKTNIDSTHTPVVVLSEMSEVGNCTNVY